MERSEFEARRKRQETRSQERDERFMNVNDIKGWPAPEKLTDSGDDQRTQVDKGGVPGREETGRRADVVGVRLFDERPIPTWPRHFDVMALDAKFVGKVTHVACYASRHRQVVRADKKDPQADVVPFNTN
jgi:hypothetical protein